MMELVDVVSPPEMSLTVYNTTVDLIEHSGVPKSVQLYLLEEHVLARSIFKR